jgi:hypothetical protein
VDNVDRVQAGGDNGFNLRFHALEAEFGRLHDVVTVLNTALDALGQKPPAQPVNTSLAPVISNTQGTGWASLQGVAIKAAGQTSAHGMMPINLPNGSTIQSFRATGRNAGGANTFLRGALFRQGLTADAAPQRIALMNLTGDPFDQSTAPDTTLAQVDTDHFRYYIMADLDGAGANDNIQLAAFQVTHIAS